MRKTEGDCTRGDVEVIRWLKKNAMPWPCFFLEDEEGMCQEMQGLQL